MQAQLACRLYLFLPLIYLLINLIYIFPAAFIYRRAVWSVWGGRGGISQPVGHEDGLCLAKLPMNQCNPLSSSPCLPWNIVIPMLFAGTALPGSPPTLPAIAQPSAAALPPPHASSARSISPLRIRYN